MLQLESYIHLLVLHSRVTLIVRLVFLLTLVQHRHRLPLPHQLQHLQLLQLKRRHQQILLPRHKHQQILQPQHKPQHHHLQEQGQRLTRYFTSVQMELSFMVWWMLIPHLLGLLTYIMDSVTHLLNFQVQVVRI